MYPCSGCLITSNREVELNEEGIFDEKKSGSRRVGELRETDKSSMVKERLSVCATISIRWMECLVEKETPSLEQAW